MTDPALMSMMMSLAQEMTKAGLELSDIQTLTTEIQKIAGNKVSPLPDSFKMPEKMETLLNDSKKTLKDDSKADPIEKGEEKKSLFSKVTGFFSK